MAEFERLDVNATLTNKKHNKRLEQTIVSIQCSINAVWSELHERLEGFEAIALRQKKDRDNHANQMNPNNDAYSKNRGGQKNFHPPTTTTCALPPWPLRLRSFVSR